MAIHLAYRKVLRTGTTTYDQHLVSTDDHLLSVRCTKAISNVEVVIPPCDEKYCAVVTYATASSCSVGRNITTDNTRTSVVADGDLLYNEMQTRWAALTAADWKSTTLGGNSYGHKSLLSYYSRGCGELSIANNYDLSNISKRYEFCEVRNALKFDLRALPYNSSTTACLRFYNPSALYTGRGSWGPRIIRFPSTYHTFNQTGVFDYSFTSNLGAPSTYHNEKYGSVQDFPYFVTGSLAPFANSQDTDVNNVTAGHLDPWNCYGNSSVAATWQSYNTLAYYRKSAGDIGGEYYQDHQIGNDQLKILMDGNSRYKWLIIGGRGGNGIGECNRELTFDGVATQGASKADYIAPATSMCFYASRVELVMKISLDIFND